MVPVKSSQRWTDWEADSLFDEEEKKEDLSGDMFAEELSGDMFDVSASPDSSPIVDERSCNAQAEVAGESGKDESREDESRKDESGKDESWNRFYLEKTQLAVTEEQKKVPVNVQKPMVVIDLVDSPSPIQKAKRSSVWLSSRKKKQTRLDFFLRPAAVANKTFKAPLAKVIPVVPSPSTTAQQRSIVLLPTQAAPSSSVQQESIEPIEIDSSADESPLIELSSSQGTSSEPEPEAVERQLEVTIAPFTQHATVGNILLEQTIAPSSINDANDVITPELSPLIEESAPNSSSIKINHLKRQRASSPTVGAASKPISSSSFINTYDDFELPRRDEPNAGEVIRNKKERDRLHGFDCMCCKSYYDGLNLSPKSRAERINQVSRHRAVQMMPLTPENYWEVDMPDTQECIKRGYIKDSPYVRRQPKNWRPRRQRTKKDDETDVR